MLLKKVKFENKNRNAKNMYCMCESGGGLIIGCCSMVESSSNLAPLSARLSFVGFLDSLVLQLFLGGQQRSRIDDKFFALRTSQQPGTTRSLFQDGQSPVEDLLLSQIKWNTSRQLYLNSVSSFEVINVPPNEVLNYPHLLAALLIPPPRWLLS